MGSRQVKCIRIATKADRDAIGRLRLAAFLASPDFHMPDDDWAKSHLPWSTEDDRAVVLGVWDGTELLATMRTDFVADRHAAESKFDGAIIPECHIEWPAFTLNRAATREGYRQFGLNALMRMHFIAAAQRSGVRRLYGYVVLGAARTKLMTELGYEFEARPDQDPFHPPKKNAWAVAWLDLPKYGQHAVNTLAAMLAEEIRQYEWQGSKLDDLRSILATP